MKLKELNNLLNQIELLAVDTQPIRDLINIIQLQPNRENKFKSLLDTLRQVLNLNFFKPGSCPQEVVVLLDSIRDKIVEPDEDENVQSKVSAYNNKDMLILSTLVGIKKEIESIKNINQSVNNNNRKQDVLDVTDDNTVEMGTVFVEPNIDVSNIKAKINIEAKKEESILDKLNLLKKLKKLQ
jgi:hypothetical protein